MNIRNYAKLLGISRNHWLRKLTVTYTAAAAHRCVSDCVNRVEHSSCATTTILETLERRDKQHCRPRSRECDSREVNPLSPVHTGDKVEFDTVDFVESRPCRLGPVHTGNKVDRIGNKFERVGNKVDSDKLSNSRCCRFVAKTGNKVDRIGNKVDRTGDSRLCCRFVAGFGNSEFQRSRPCWL